MNAEQLIERVVAGESPSEVLEGRELKGKHLQSELEMLIHDYGDEYGWDEKFRLTDIMDELADQMRKQRVTYDQDEAHKILRKIAPKRLAVDDLKKTTAPPKKRTANLAYLKYKKQAGTISPDEKKQLATLIKKK